MNENSGRYRKKWTDLSLKELANFARWMNEKVGYHPTIIGGWAVYLYNPGLGSIDIDVVLPERKIKDKVINTYLVNNGYEIRQRAFGEEEWVKYLEPGNQDSETFLDVCTLQDKNIVHGKGNEIPWSIATKWQRPERVEGYDIFLPQPEPLLVLKVKAAWDRNYDISQSGGDPFLKDKVTKDRYDILSLISKCTMKYELIDKIVTKYDFTDCFSDALSRTITDISVIHWHGYNDTEVKNLRDKISEIIDKLEK